MQGSVIRISEIEMCNFKNVKHGVLNLDNTRKSYKSSVLGLYGQNGSGKTALIDALSVLKYALTGKALPDYYGDFVNVDCDSSKLIFRFKIWSESLKTTYNAQYELCLKKELDESDQNADYDIQGQKYKTVLFNEVLSYGYQNTDNQVRMQTLANTGADGLLSPVTKMEVLIGKDKKLFTDLLVAKKIAYISSRSFLFSPGLLNTVRKNCEDVFHVELFNLLTKYGNTELFIIDTQKSGMLSLNTIPLNFKVEENGKISLGSVLINLNEPSLIPQDALDIVRTVVDRMNIVLVQMVPGLTIGLEELGTELLRNGETGCKVQLVSHKNSKVIPLKYESEGIKKIVSVLQLLIVVYNQSSITVAIDELDSGIFEYLLGELLHIISEQGKGQLIFTSHNLRPLETIDKSFIAFTTTNPDRRYIRFSNVKTNNNLRDFYYRDIELGEQDEEVYSPTNNFEIALAFREAGVVRGS
ncbi:MAG: AAA family ATPase [Oscillospiraceae bacterium]|nr:AAA family ATPase [Oscillospiraceae bacterium]